MADMSNTDDGIVVVARAICEFRHGWREDAGYIDRQWHLYKQEAKAAIDAYTAHLRDKGVVVVPRECTEEMFVAGRSALRNNSTRTGNARVAYKAMVAAASPVQSER